MIGVELARQRGVVLEQAGEHLGAPLGEVLVDAAVPVVVPAVERILVDAAVLVVVAEGQIAGGAGSRVMARRAHHDAGPGLVHDGVDAGRGRELAHRLPAGDADQAVAAGADPQSGAVEVLASGTARPLARGGAGVAAGHGIAGAEQAEVGDVQVQAAGREHGPAVGHRSLVGRRIAGDRGRGQLQRAAQEARHDGQHRVNAERPSRLRERTQASEHVQELLTVGVGARTD
ncbi:MAG: hypothetical protein R3D98_15020 [Candidatus Krumholzibacteriia bacterium]